MIADTSRSPALAPPWLRCVLSAALLVVLYLALGAAAGAIVVVSGRVTTAGAVAAAAAATALAVAALRRTVTAAIDEPSMRAQTLGTSRPTRAVLPLLAAVGVQVIAVPVLIVLARATGLHGDTTLPPGSYSPQVAALVALSAIVLAPWMEEVSMRGLLFTGLQRRFGFWPAALVSGFAWSALHRAPLVLVAFTVAGVALCWLRARTGSVRWGIGVHGAWNALVAALLVHWWAALGLAVLIATMALARDDLRAAPLRAIRRLLGGLGSAGAVLARRLPGRSPAGARALLSAGVLLAAGVGLEAAHRYHAAGGWADGWGRVTVAGASVLLAAVAAGSPTRWAAASTAAATGIAGGLLGAAAHLATALGARSLAALDGLGYLLVAWWLWQLGGSGLTRRAAIGAHVAALGLLLALVPPTRTGAWFTGTSLGALLIAAAGLCLLGAGASARAEPAAGLAGAVSSAVSRLRWSDRRWAWATVAAAAVVAAVVISLPQEPAGAVESACASGGVRVTLDRTDPGGHVGGWLLLTARRRCGAYGVVTVRTGLATAAGRPLPPSLIGLPGLLRWRGAVPAARTGSVPARLRFLLSRQPALCAMRPEGGYLLTFSVIGGRSRVQLPLVCDRGHVSGG